MTDITIPPEAVEAAAEAFLQCDRVPSYSFDDAIRAALIAGLKAWPGMFHHPARPDEEECIFLPVDQEPSDE